LVIPRIQLDHAGTYICTASNPAGQASTRASISVVQVSNQIQADISSFRNPVAMGSTVCHNPNKLGFEVRYE